MSFALAKAAALNLEFAVSNGKPAFFLSAFVQAKIPSGVRFAFGVAFFSTRNGGGATISLFTISATFSLTFSNCKTDGSEISVSLDPKKESLKNQKTPPKIMMKSKNASRLFMRLLFHNHNSGHAGI